MLKYIKLVEQDNPKWITNNYKEVILLDELDLVSDEVVAAIIKMIEEPQCVIVNAAMKK